MTNPQTTTFEKVGEREIEMRRFFPAPREVVFKAYTDPEAIPEWWGPAYLTTTVETMDVRPGGTWRYIQRDAEGNEYAFHGEYLEVVPPERLVSTFVYEGAPGTMTDAATFEERDGGTLLVVRSTADEAASLEAAEAEGMADGAIESWERLAAYVAKVAA